MDALIKKLAGRAGHNWAFHVAIVKRGGAVVAVGYNHDRTHAETMALSKLWPSKRRGTRIVSIRVRKDGSFALAKPCAPCLAFLRQNGVKQVIYTTRDGTLEKMKL